MRFIFIAGWANVFCNSKQHYKLNYKEKELYIVNYSEVNNKKKTIRLWW